ncbi:deleted in malignant brain tumors 1 protein-like [Mauremys mutica]|uniref:deleted in malignant brain tumors 1 protein-like n=1 Tax=Mauremys mutica TaxID=74926 RepID=UPI001D16182C|nr:deleted in malignant brain tumors 1 protein-like [Mauremys mutica]
MAYGSWDIATLTVFCVLTAYELKLRFIFPPGNTTQGERTTYVPPGNTTQGERTTYGDQCGGFLSNPSGSFSSPYYPGNGLITQCVWQIQIEYNRIVLVFSYVSLNCFQEFIEIYDGPLYASPLLGKICNGSNLSYVSSSNTLTVLLRRDSYNSEYGFSAYYTSLFSELPPSSASGTTVLPGNTTQGERTTYGDQCGGFLSNPSGSFSSPYYPGNGLITQCVWQIQIEYNRIVLVFSYVSLNCFQEFIEIYDGPLYASPLLGKICNGSNLSYVSSSNTLTVLLRRDSYNSEYGFSAYYTSLFPDTALPSTPPTTINSLPSTPPTTINSINGSCGGYLSTASGSFSSPFFPENYPVNVQCVWRIEVKNNYYIRLIFKHLELEVSYNCAYDFVEVYDGPLNTSPLLGRICDGSNYTFTSSSNTMTVLFSSDFSYTRSGFSAYYDSFPEKNNDTALACSGQYMLAVINRSYLQSLGYNAWDVYLNDSSCGPQQITETYVIFNIPFNGCGTIRQVKNNTIMYSNVIRTSPSGYIITRKSNFQFHVTCTMNQDTMVEIMYVAKGDTDISAAQHGRYDVNISFYESSNFSNPVYNSPYYVDLNQDLFLQATLYSSDSNLVMFTDTCMASPYSDGFTNLTYVLIRNGCVRDSTYSSYYSPMGYIVRFKFNAFKFLNRHATIYLQCKIVVCRAYDYSSRCYQGCLARRKRDTSPYQEKLDVVVGPVQRKKETNEDRKADPHKREFLEKDDVRSPFVLATLLLAGVVLVLIGALLRSKLRRRTEYQVL